MKTIRIKSKDEINPTYINYVEPEDLNNINSYIVSYIKDTTYSLGENLNSYISRLEEDTTYKFNYISDYYDNELYNMNKSILDLGVQFTYTISYNLPESETDKLLRLTIEEIDERLTYAVRRSTNDSYNFNLQTNSTVQELRNYIDSHIREVENIPSSYLWFNWS